MKEKRKPKAPLPSDSNHIVFSTCQSSLYEGLYESIRKSRNRPFYLENQGKKTLVARDNLNLQQNQ